MSNEPEFASIGFRTDTIDVRLSYKIVDLFSEGLYASPNKAIEELVANAFDAGALRVQVLMASNLHAQDATIAIIDDGEGMDAKGLKQHWLIGDSNKRHLSKLPRKRQQIGKFGIGKLATYVLANRLTHISKRKGKYYSTSMDYLKIDSHSSADIIPRAPIKIPLRELTEAEAKKAVKQWINASEFKKSKMVLFGQGAPSSWTIAIMSSLKDKVHEIKPGMLDWILRTALPLRPDFEVWHNGNKLESSKEGKGLIKRWTLGKGIKKLPKPGPKDATAWEGKHAGKGSEHRFGLNVPGLGRVTGYAEAYEELITGKSDEIFRSYGFFVYVYGRLVNVVDGHFGISPNELRHGTFGRFRLVVHMDGLDQALRSNREAISEGPLLTTAQNVLRAIFNFVRPTIEGHDEAERPGARLARKLSSTPASLSRRPIIALAQAVIENKRKSKYLLVPELKDPEKRSAFISELERRATEKSGKEFITDLKLDYNGSADQGIALYDTSTGELRINAFHPFVATFHDQFTNKHAQQPLELMAMAEVLAEAHLYTVGVGQQEIDSFLSLRDQLLRHLANESGRESAFSVSLALQEARNDASALEEKVCKAFQSLGFEVTPVGGKGEPDGIATALLSADASGSPRQYTVSLEAKSKKEDKGKVAASTVDVAAVIRHRDQYKCQHALVVGRAFPTSQGDKSALAKDIADDRTKTAKVGTLKTISLITIDDLGKLVRLRPVKQLGLQSMRDLFLTCGVPEDTSKWINLLEEKTVTKPPYTTIVNTIEALQKKRSQARVSYNALATELSHAKPPVNYATDEELKNICMGMAQMAPLAMSAGPDTVELDQSAANVISAINAAMQDLANG